MSRLKPKHVIIILLILGSFLSLRPQTKDPVGELLKHRDLKQSLILDLKNSQAANSAPDGAQVEVSPKNQESRLPQILKDQASDLSLITEDPEKIEEQAKALASSMIEAELQELLSMAVNENKNKEERLAAVYLLMSAEEKGQNFLLNILYSTSEKMNKNVKPHSREEQDKNFELNIRIMALQGIERNILSTRGAVDSLGSKTTENSYLNALVDIVVRGRKIQQPLLKRFIDESVRGAKI